MGTQIVRYVVNDVIYRLLGGRGQFKETVIYVRSKR